MDFVIFYSLFFFTRFFFFLFFHQLNSFVNDISSFFIEQLHSTKCYFCFQRGTKKIIVYIFWGLSFMNCYSHIFYSTFPFFMVHFKLILFLIFLIFSMDLHVLHRFFLWFLSYFIIFFWKYFFEVHFFFYPSFLHVESLHFVFIIMLSSWECDHLLLPRYCNHSFLIFLTKQPVLIYK